MTTMKTTKPLPTWRLAKVLKPRNPVLAALKTRQGGAHGKSQGALRRAGKMALRKHGLNDD